MDEKIENLKDFIGLIKLPNSSKQTKLVIF